MSVPATDDAPAQARRAIEYILRLELEPGRWDRIGPILGAVADAAAAGDLTALQAAAGELLLASPLRVTKPDGLDQVPAGPPIHERANRALDALSAMRAVTADDDRKGPGEDGR
jgi:hypothetical protein